ncbi:hypothetical protein [Parabacteroides sp. Marseille-P3160]|uniref:hypothetical protein n=1 Tax=Parabacteroides sp. Marseille-P3160 TaxID=1917887 RepID=UPI0009BA4773|nr:hypothetical protein [Parabacteroides sp. Marseille-P3160]
MQSNDCQQIEKLLERFFEGETSNAEEQELYKFFARKNLPEYWKPYRPLFDYFETGIACETTGMGKVKPVRKIFSAQYYLIAGLVIAASLLLILVLNNRGEMKSDDFNPYAGSYRVRNGVRTEIPEKIARQLYEERIANYNSRQLRDITEKRLGKEIEMEKLEQHINQIEKKYMDKLKQTE